MAQQGSALFLMDADGSLAETVDRAAIEQRLQSGGCFWLDVRTPGDEEFRMLSEVFHFHPLALEDSRAFGQRPKLDNYDDFAFMVVYGASPDEDGLVALGAFWLPVLIVFLAGAFAIFYAWQESKRYTL